MLRNVLLGAVALLATLVSHSFAADVKLLNVSYDPTRELYQDINQAFLEQYKPADGGKVIVEQSHGGSGKQARAVIDGLKADVVTLALGYDITSIEKAGLITAGWEKRLPQNASPYTSTIVFLVRKGNPKNIKDWDDTIRDGVQVIVPNPKTSGGARWAFLAAYGYGGGLHGNAGDKLDDAKAKDFIAKFYKNVPVLDTGARGSTITFAQKNVGDVLPAWENEAWLAQEEFGKDNFDIVYPSVTILAEPPVAVVDKNVDEKGTRAVAEAYVKFLYTPAAQDIIGQNHYRPRDPDAAKKYEKDLPPLKLFDITAFNGWNDAQKIFFADGGVFDQINSKK